jgi:hypothetical protein
LLETDVGAPTTLGEVLAQALGAAREPVQSETSLGFFLAPLARGERLVAEARKHEPTLVVALDFLFWFGYGQVAQEAQRLERLEQGLALLERFECPLVVGDYPDMTPALRGRGPLGAPMLFASQIPAPETRAALNRRLAGWAAERPRVAVVPLAAFLERLRRGEALELRGNRWTSDAELFRPDRLHPTLAGSAALVVLALDQLAGREPGLPQDALRWDAAEIARAAYAAKEEPRQKALAAKREREERRVERQAR